MSELRLLTDASQLDYSKLIEPQSGELIVPVVCIDSFKMVSEGLGAYRMQGFANQAAVETTLKTGRATFFSRKRSGLWVKGEESGNFLIVRASYTDCDFDSILYDVDAQGPTCHKGPNSCFEINDEGE